MIIDYNLLFSNNQAVTTSAASTNVMDLSVQRDIGVGDDPNLQIVAIVTTAFAGGTSIQCTLQGSTDNSAFYDMVAGPVVTTTNAAAGARLANFEMPVVGAGQSVPRYIRLYYTVVGTMTAGNVYGTMVIDRQANLAYAPGIAIAN